MRSATAARLLVASPRSASYSSRSSMSWRRGCRLTTTCRLPTLSPVGHSLTRAWLTCLASQRPRRSSAMPMRVERGSAVLVMVAVVGLGIGLCLAYKSDHERPWLLTLLPVAVGLALLVVPEFDGVAFVLAG